MEFETPEGRKTFAIETAIVAGWTGRDSAAVAHHIEELKALGVAPPSRTPLFYRVSHSLLTQATTIQVLGLASSGEIEPLLVRAEDRLWLGLGSDQTDRALEAVSVAASKQVCAKPVAPSLWAFDEVEGHLDQVALRCEIEEGGIWVRYQEGTLASILPLRALADEVGLPEGSAMLCGTLAALGGVRPAERYRMTLHDPVRDRTIALSYTVACLPVVS